MWVPLLALFTAASLVDAAFYGQILAFTPLFFRCGARWRTDTRASR